MADMFDTCEMGDTCEMAEMAEVSDIPDTYAAADISDTCGAANIIATYGQCVGFMRRSVDAVLVAGAYKLHSTYRPPNQHDPAAYLRWLHVILQKLCEVYAYIHAHIGVDTDTCTHANTPDNDYYHDNDSEYYNDNEYKTADKGTLYATISASLVRLIRAIMATAPSLYRCGVVAYMDECTTRVNTCAGMLQFDQIPKYGRMRVQAARLYRKFATHQHVSAAEYANYTCAVAWSYRHFRQMPYCPTYMHTVIGIAYYLARLSPSRLFP